jgi:hypothetical protein
MPVTLPYNQLLLAIQGYLERYNDTDLVTNFPTIVMLAQNRIDNDLKSLGEIDIFTGSFSPPAPNSTNNILAKPSDWKFTLTFEIRTGTGTSIATKILKKTGYDDARFIWPDDSISAPPVYYVDDIQLSYYLIAPPPDLPYQYRVSYVKRNPLLDPNNQSNWLTQNEPRLLFDAVFLETIIYLKNSVRLPEVQALYDKTLTNYRGMDLENIEGRRSDRSKV